MRSRIVYMFIGVFVGACVLVSTTHAVPLTLVTDASTSTPPAILPGAVSDPFSFTLINDTAVDAPEDLLTGWQVTLDIEPLPGATGTVEIFDVSQPAAGYLLEGSGFGLGANRNGENLTVFDFILFASPVQVPVDPGAPLFEYTLEASTDALGGFGIYAVGRLSEWSDSASPIIRAREYNNLPFNGGSVLIGKVTVIPEPTSLALLGLGGLAFCRRNRAICTSTNRH